MRRMVKSEIQLVVKNKLSCGHASIRNSLGDSPYEPEEKR